MYMYQTPICSTLIGRRRSTHCDERSKNISCVYACNLQPPTLLPAKCESNTTMTQQDFFDTLFTQDPIETPVEQTPHVFTINDTCSTQSQDGCTNTCVWDRSSSKCVPAGLFVRDTNGAEYTLDTGSSIAALSNTYCKSKGIETHGTTIVRNYGSFQDVKDTPTRHPVHILGQLMQPTCSSVHLPDTPDALIGAAPTTNTSVRPHSLMENIPKGSRRIKIDRYAGTTCIGCDGEEEAWEPMLDLPTSVKFIALESEYGKTVLDTGSTFTSKVSDTLCLVGFEDINYLHVDYDRNRVSYDINSEHIDTMCGAGAPNKLNGV